MWHYPVPAAKCRPLVNSYRRTGYSSVRLGRHWAIDIVAPLGAKVRAIRDAKVVAVGNVWGASYGKQVLLRWRTPRGFRFFFYSHLDSYSVAAGDKVKKGQVIGRVGSTGNSTGPHCHVEWATCPRKIARWDMHRKNPYRNLERARKKLLAA